MSHLRSFALSVIGVSTGLLIYCGSFYVKSFRENRLEQKKYDSIKESCIEEKSTDEKISLKEKLNEKAVAEAAAKAVSEEAAEEFPHIEESFGISWEKLKEINPETAAWIEIPGADVSYPVVQGADDEYYLNHSFEREESPFGSIFLGCVNQGDFLDSHNFLYGHNMEGNMMFANLNRYENREFLEKYPGFNIITPKRLFRYEIFSVEQANENGISFTYGYELGSDAYGELLEILKMNSMYDTGVLPDKGQTMVTLVTCNSRLDENVRMAVHGICRGITVWNTETDGL